MRRLIHTCPKRFLAHAGAEDDGLDHWTSERWGCSTWNIRFRPLACSFCGSIRPQDAIKLVGRYDWEVQEDKPGKYLLEPEGYKQWKAECRKYGGEAIMPRGLWLPLPVVKLFDYHLNPRTRDIFRDLCRR